MIAALDVNLVGGESEALHILLAVVGPILIAGAAVFAARTARNSANERQQRQLAHDTDRQETALGHDREMREWELAHDREMRSRERALDTLDSTVDNANKARTATNALAARIYVADKWRPRHERELAEAATQMEKARAVERLAATSRKSSELSSACFDARMALNSDYTRLRLRSPDHESPQASRKSPRQTSSSAQ